ncbi:HNH endonuclease [Escherichia phage vB_EcoM_50EP]|nr:HNH endonuclease [Escherichia phage vB_EcoM_50EP]
MKAISNDWTKHFELVNDRLFWIRGNNQIRPGDLAGYVMNGYLYSEVNGVCHPHHRIIWEMRHGVIPEGMEVDHINHIRDDNSDSNHRLVSRSGNCRNFSKSPLNKSGVCGVVWRSDRNTWLAQVEIKDGGKRRNIKLGTSKDWFEAVCMRMSANARLGFHENHGR